MTFHLDSHDLALGHLFPYKTDLGILTEDVDLDPCDLDHDPCNLELRSHFLKPG